MFGWETTGVALMSTAAGSLMADFASADGEAVADGDAVEDVVVSGSAAGAAVSAAQPVASRRELRRTPAATLEACFFTHNLSAGPSSASMIVFLVLLRLAARASF